MDKCLRPVFTNLAQFDHDQRSNLAQMSRSIERGLIAAQNRYSPTPIKARSNEPSLIRAQTAGTAEDAVFEGCA